MMQVQIYENTIQKKRIRKADVRRGLDTLEYLPPCNGGAGLKGADIITPIFPAPAQSDVNNLDKLNKRARSKYLQKEWLTALASLNSPLKKNYRFALKCSQEIIQDGVKLKTKYCGNRFCIICNRIRTGKLINGYTTALDTMQDKRFVTLTRPNVKAEHLKTEIDSLYQVWRKIARRAVKQKILFRGIRKLEVTYNPERNDYHPHFHLIVDGEHTAEWIVNEWISFNPSANRKAQDHREAHDPKELFKYCTKMLTKASKLPGASSFFYPVQMDIIFCALRNCRTFQPFGDIRMISEDIETETALVSTHVDAGDDVWTWTGEGWTSTGTGEMLTTFTPTHREKDYRQRIRWPGVRKDSEDLPDESPEIMRISHVSSLFD